MDERASGEAVLADAGRAGLPRVDHLGIVVPDLTAAAALYRELGGDVTAPMTLEGQGIDKVYARFANLVIELIQPTATPSPIRHLLEDQNASDFLARQPRGGLHHVCLMLADLRSTSDELVAGGRRLLGTEAAALDNAERAIVWLDPAGADGVLIELKQGAASSDSPASDS